jgi:hypoxanthine phosphoribosyltransferase
MEFSHTPGDIARIVVDEDAIAHRIAQMARQVEKDLADSTPVLVGVLTGAFMVMADFAREVALPVTIDWMVLSSYGMGNHSSGEITVVKDLAGSVEGRDVIVVEDIIDTGQTIQWLIDHLNSRGVKSLRVLTLLRKPDAAVVEVPVDYVGFDIPNDFVVGYGLDFAGRYRNLRGVGVLDPSVWADGS